MFTINIQPFPQSYVLLLLVFSVTGPVLTEFSVLILLELV